MWPSRPGMFWVVYKEFVIRVCHNARIVISKVIIQFSIWLEEYLLHLMYFMLNFFWFFWRCPQGRILHFNWKQHHCLIAVNAKINRSITIISTSARQNYVLPKSIHSQSNFFWDLTVQMQKENWNWLKSNFKILARICWNWHARRFEDVWGLMLEDEH